MFITLTVSNFTNSVVCTDRAGLVHVLGDGGRACEDARSCEGAATFSTLSLRPAAAQLGGGGWCVFFVRWPCPRRQANGGDAPGCARLFPQSLGVEFLLKTESGYLSDAEVT